LSRNCKENYLFFLIIPLKAENNLNILRFYLTYLRQLSIFAIQFLDIFNNKSQKGVMMKKNRFSFKQIAKINLAVVLMVSLFSFSACSEDDESIAPVNPIEQYSKVMAVHASPDAPGVDLYVDNGLAGTNLEFPNSTGYLEVTSGTRNVKVNVTGTETTVIEANLPLEANKNYTVFAIDEVANLMPLVVEDNLSAPASGKAHVRFFHLSPDAPAVDITLTDGTVVIGNTSFMEYTQFLPLDAAMYDLQVRVAGTDTVVLELEGLSLMDGKIYTVFAKGFVSGSDKQALGAEIILNN
jgi:hypothetical protein